MAVYTDDFNRADGALGANWTVVDLAISSNAVIAAAGGYAFCRARWAGGSVGNDQYSQEKVLVATTDSHPYVLVRADTEGTWNCYAADSLGQLIRTNQWGGATQLGTFTPPSVGDVFRIEISGSDLLVKINGTSVEGPVTDSTFASGKPGMAAVYSGTPSVTVIDDWEGGDLAAAGPVIPVFLHQYRQRWS